MTPACTNIDVDVFVEGGEIRPSNKMSEANAMIAFN